MSEIRETAVLSPVARRSRLSDHVVEKLSRLIIEGVIEPGTAIRTEELARQLGVSRTPMREALQRLEQDGFVTVAPNGVAKVVNFDLDEALEMMDVREIVDGLAARLLAERGVSRAVFDELSEMAARMEKASAREYRRKLATLVRFERRHGRSASCPG